MLVARALAHTPQAKPSEAGIFHGARPSGKGLYGLPVCSIKRACRYRNWSFLPGGTERWWWRAHAESAHCKLDRNQPRRRLLSGHPPEPTHSTQQTHDSLRQRGDFYFPPNGILLLCVDPLLILVEVWL